MIAAILMEMKTFKSEELDENMARHMFLNSLRSYKVKFGDTYGELVLACDHTDVWRKKSFPYYKANRKKNKEDSTINWQSIYDCINKIREEIKENFPYKILHVHTAEGDDVIATIVSEFGSEMNTGEPILIISSDDDYGQLQKYGNVSQYNPIRKKPVVVKNPEQFLKEHIIQGCTGDGVPNILSADNCFVMNVRQGRMTAGRLEHFLKTDPNKYESEAKRNYFRNREMIDLSYIPVDLHQKIMDEFNSQSGKDRSKLMNYFMNNKLKLLQEAIGDF